MNGEAEPVVRSIVLHVLDILPEVTVEYSHRNPQAMSHRAEGVTRNPIPIRSVRGSRDRVEFSSKLSTDLCRNQYQVHVQQMLGLPGIVIKNGLTLSIVS